MASIGPSSLGAKGCVAVAQGSKAVVWRLLKMKGRQYDKTHLVSWWVGRYSRRGLPLRGRGAYGPVLTHGPRVVAADAAGAEALVGVLKIIKDASYNKTREPPWRAMEKRHPPLVDCATTFPPAEAQCYLVKEQAEEDQQN